MSSSSAQLDNFEALYNQLTVEQKAELGVCDFADVREMMAKAGPAGEVMLAAAARRVQQYKVRDTVPGLLVRYENLSSNLKAYVKAEWKATITAVDNLSVERIIALSPADLAKFAALLQQCESAQRLSKD
jgi:hypothetical protein